MTVFDSELALKSKAFKTNQLRLQNLSNLLSVIESIFKNFTTDDLVTLLNKENIPVSKVNQMSDIATNSWFTQSGAVLSLTHPQIGVYLTAGSSIKFDNNLELKTTPAPTLGQDNDTFGISNKKV